MKKQQINDCVPPLWNKLPPALQQISESSYTSSLKPLPLKSPRGSLTPN